MTFPDWVTQARLQDERFERAYAAVPDRIRSLLKTAIARHYAWHGRSPVLNQKTSRTFSQGFAALERCNPFHSCLVLQDEASPSPARLLAAIMPALCAGVRDLFVLRIKTNEEQLGLSDTQLVALELAGVENVAECSPEDGKRLLEHLVERCAVCAVIALGKTVSLVPGTLPDWQRPVFAAGPVGRCALWLDGAANDGDDPDHEALALLQPDVSFSVLGPGAQELDLSSTHFHVDIETTEGLERCSGDAAYVPERLLGNALQGFAASFGPGHEGCWLWPDLGVDFFIQRRTAWRRTDAMNAGPAQKGNENQ